MSRYLAMSCVMLMGLMPPMAYAARCINGVAMLRKDLKKERLAVVSAWTVSGLCGHALRMWNAIDHRTYLFCPHPDHYRPPFAQGLGERIIAEVFNRGPTWKDINSGKDMEELPICSNVELPFEVAAQLVAAEEQFIQARTDRFRTLRSQATFYPGAMSLPRKPFFEAVLGDIGTTVSAVVLDEAPSFTTWWQRWKNIGIETVHDAERGEHYFALYRRAADYPSKPPTLFLVIGDGPSLPRENPIYVHNANEDTHQHYIPARGK